MRRLTNPSLFSIHARFPNVITGVDSFWPQGVERCLNNSSSIKKMSNIRVVDEMHQHELTVFAKRLGLGSRSIIGFISLHPNLFEKFSTIGRKFGNSIRQEHSVSSEWLAKRWAEEKRRKDMMRRRRRRDTQCAETKEPIFDTSFNFPFMQSFFTRSIPAEQRWQSNEASVQPPMSQHEEGFLYPQTSEEVKLAPLLARSNLLITRDIEWANIMFAFEQENRYAVIDPCYPQSPVGFIREQSNVLMRQVLRLRRPFVAVIMDAMGNEIFRVRRPFWWITSTIYVEVDGKKIGVVRMRWHLWRRIYDLYYRFAQLVKLEEKFKSLGVNEAEYSPSVH